MSLRIHRTAPLGLTLAVAVLTSDTSAQSARPGTRSAAPATERVLFETGFEKFEGYDPDFDLSGPATAGGASAAIVKDFERHGVKHNAGRSSDRTPLDSER